MKQVRSSKYCCGNLYAQNCSTSSPSIIFQTKPCTYNYYWELGDVSKYYGKVCWLTPPFTVCLRFLSKLSCMMQRNPYVAFSESISIHKKLFMAKYFLCFNCEIAILKEMFACIKKLPDYKEFVDEYLISCSKIYISSNFTFILLMWSLQMNWMGSLLLLVILSSNISLTCCWFSYSWWIFIF